MIFLQSLRMTQRDWRAGELRFLLIALIVAVASLSAVGFFVDRMRAGLSRDAHKLGDRSFAIAKVLVVEPDRGSGFINFAPRVMLSMADLASTNLVQDGSRVTYRLLLAGPGQQVQDFQKWVESDISRENVK